MTDQIAINSNINSNINANASSNANHCTSQTIAFLPLTNDKSDNDAQAPNAANTIGRPAKTQWQQDLAHAFKSADALFDFLQLDAAARAVLHTHDPRQFGLLVPHSFAAKMQKNNPADPLLLQMLPTAAELQTVAGFVADPLEELAQTPARGILHKYKNRLLLTLTGACAVHCRYCFRQHYEYSAHAPDVAEVVAYVQKSGVREVILSGGDPLALATGKLARYLTALLATDITTLRIHTRLPVVLPSRVDEDLCTLLQQISNKKHLVVVLHVNHPDELGDKNSDNVELNDVYHALKRLKSTGATLLNQSVLLKGINDDADVLAALSEKLFIFGVLPYYLHTLDKVAGAAHFYLPDDRAIAIHWQLLARLSGYLVPRLVRELPHLSHKTPVDIYKAPEFG